MRRNDRMVHAKLADGREVVRYDVSGEWYVERPDGCRDAVKIAEAVTYALQNGATVHLERPGGGRFDAAIRRARASS